MNKIAVGIVSLVVGITAGMGGYHLYTTRNVTPAASNPVHAAAQPPKSAFHTTSGPQMPEQPKLSPFEAELEEKRRQFNDAKRATEDLKKSQQRAAGVERVKSMDLAQLREQLRTAAAHGKSSMELHTEQLQPEQRWTYCQSDQSIYTSTGWQPMSSTCRLYGRSENSREMEFKGMAEALSSELGINVSYSLIGTDHMAVELSASWK